jgi:hypothetical protein
LSGLQLFGHPGRSGLNARFYFDVTTDGVTAADPDGLDLPSLDAARKEARTTAAEMAKEDEACPKDITIGVRDRSGPAPVATVRLSLRCE